MLLVGLVFGRWWRVVIPAGTVGWALLLAATGIVSDLSHFGGAAAFGFINVTVGVLVFQAFRLVFQVFRLGSRRLSAASNAKSRP
jgi:hypothetical protein